MKKNVPINYTDRDFNSIKQSLVDHARRYYPDTFKDFNDASFGALMLDTVAYVGDVLSFYLDYQANESFLETAIEKENVINLSKNLGYKYSESISAYGECDFFVNVPATSNSGPDLGYAPVLKSGATLASTDGGQYTLINDVDFSNPENLTVVSEVDDATGTPTKYAVKATGLIKSGFIEEAIVPVAEFERFRSIELEDDNISEIVSVEDSEGHVYYEVEHLSQDVIYVDVSNRNTDKHVVSNIIKPLSVPRRFTVDFFPGSVQIQFGQGSDLEILSGSFLDPSKVTLRQFGKQFISDTYLDPTNFTSTDKMGISPSKTTLSIRYRKDDADNVNATPGSITTITDSEIQFVNESNLVSVKVAGVRNSIECFNENAILGDQSTPSEEEVKIRAKNSYAAQNRAVTRQDYVSMAYALPSKFGSIKRARVEVDKDSFKRNINMFVTSENLNGDLADPSLSLKNNLKTWINLYRMMGDTFDIIDAKIVNLSINFEIIVAQNFTKSEALSSCVRELQEFYRIKPEIGEPFYLNDVYRVLNELESVVDVTDVTVQSESGIGYSSLVFDIDSNLSLDGRILILPFDHIYEIKNPSINIKGSTL